MRPQKKQLARLIDPIKWLSSYDIYPKFYWRAKESELEFATLGCKKKLVKLSEVENFEQNVNIVLSFDLNPIKSQLWLPKYELASSKDKSYILSYTSNFPSSLKSFTFSQNKINYSKINPDFYQWDSLIKKAQKNLQKVVLAKKESFFLKKNANALSIFANLKKKSENSFLFFFQPNQHTAFLGASPEMLFKKDQQKIFSEAIAGTQKRGKNHSLDSQLKHFLLQNKKELKEFNFVKDQIEFIYKKICDHYKISEIDTCKTKWLQHLYAKFSGTLNKDLSTQALLELFHPTPAVGGYPKQESLKFINEFEHFDRLFYAAPIGRASNLCSEFAVGIRSCYIHNNQVDVFAGAGIVDSSDSNYEWEELMNKSSWIYEVL